MANVLHNATGQQLQQAEAILHTQLFELVTKADKGQVFYKEGLTYTITKNGGTISFPVMDEDKAGKQLDEMMELYRSHKAVNVGCYSLYPPQPKDLGIRLLARGFQNGWSPCWMALDLDSLENDHQGPPELVIKADQHTSTHHCTGLPYYGDMSILTHTFLLSHPERSQRFLGFIDGEIVAQSCVFFTEGDNAVAGIFNVGVVPTHRDKGIGKAIVLAACRYAKEEGYSYAILNATGRRMYSQLGFQWIGNGLTWWLMSDRYITHPPSGDEVLLAESVAKGDIDRLDTIPYSDLDTPIANGMRLMELAAQYKQAAAAKWLMQHGAACKPLDAWDLGWKELFTQLLATQVNERYAEFNGTLMHIAAQRNDLGLAREALAAGADLSIRDTTYNATPLDWARHFNRPQLIELIGQATR